MLSFMVEFQISRKVVTMKFLLYLRETKTLIISQEKDSASFFLTDLPREQTFEHGYILTILKHH